MPSATRLGVVFDYADDFATNASEVTEFERVGVNVVSVAEAYSFDAVSQLGYLAAITTTMTLASGILPIFSRTPALLAMTAAGLDSVSRGRFELGIGSSGAQVIEGFHGVPFTAPLGRIRENVEICRAIWRRERMDFHGAHYTIPLPVDQGRGLGKPLKIINRPVRDTIPISIAALTSKAVAQAAEIANGWLPLFYLPEKADAAWGVSLADGRSRRSPDLGQLDVIAQVPFYLGDHVDRAIEVYRQNMALYVGGMGARGANFYNDLAVGYGFVDEAAAVQELYLTGRKDEAAEALPDELVHGTALIGTEREVRARVAALLTSGVTTISVKPLAPSRGERIEQLEALRAILG
jgi:F420-dependent oxidoreductase-like protein